VPDDCAGGRVDVALARLFPAYSRNRLQAWLKEGRIRIDGKPAEPKSKVRGGERVELTIGPLPEATSHAPEAIDLQVVFEDASIIVLDKPAGLVVHPGSGNWSGTLLNALLHRYPELNTLPRAGIVHRLDKDTTGLLVVARTIEAQTELVRQLQARGVKRHYLAVVTGRVARDDEINAPIGRHPVHRTRMAVVRNGREAITRYAVLERFDVASLVECRLETGRTHQIRVHMAHLGHALVGDETYLRRKSGVALLDVFPRQALHARRLGLLHPASGVAMEWEAPPPDDLRTLIDALRAAHAS
jgi:23S rRNA pseudouridine1911/1915/1917 synthase